MGLDVWAAQTRMFGFFFIYLFILWFNIVFKFTYKFVLVLIWSIGVK